MLIGAGGSASCCSRATFHGWRPCAGCCRKHSRIPSTTGAKSAAVLPSVLWRRRASRCACRCPQACLPADSRRRLGAPAGAAPAVPRCPGARESEATAPPSHHPPPAGLCCSAMPLCRCTTRSPFISRCALRPVATLGGPACCTRGQHPCAWRQRWHAAFRPDPACWAALHGCRWCDRVAPSTASPSNLMNFQQVHFAPLLTAGHVCGALASEGLPLPT